MKSIKALIVFLALFAVSLPGFGAELIIEPDLNSYKVDANTKKVDLSKISEKVKVESSALPIDQLSDDFNSLLSENGNIDRDAIEYDDGDVSTASESAQ